MGKKKIGARQMTGSKGNKRRKKLGIAADMDQLEEEKGRLANLVAEKRDRKRDHAERDAKRSLKKKIAEDVASGRAGAPYYMKRRDRKEAELAANYEELYKKGGDKAVDKAVAKRRKKNASKDRRHMPYSKNDEI